MGWLMQHSLALKLPLEITQCEPQRCGPAVRAIAGALDLLFALQEGRDFLLGERIPGLHRGLATGHVENFMEEFLRREFAAAGATVFQEAIQAQEKAFLKITERFAGQIEESRSRLEAHTQSTSETSKSDIAEFKSQLSKELEQFRAGINKNILPISKTIEEKIQSLQSAGKGVGENLKPTLIGIGAVLIVLCIANTAVSFMSFSKVASLESQSHR